MVYSDVIKNKYHALLPYKEKYTKRDINKIIELSFFDSSLNNGQIFDYRTARFIVLCTAIFHNAKTSKNVSNQPKIKIF